MDQQIFAALSQVQDKLLPASHTSLARWTIFKLSVGFLLPGSFYPLSYISFYITTPQTRPDVISLTLFLLRGKLCTHTRGAHFEALRVSFLR